jgi:hypothetical protein
MSAKVTGKYGLWLRNWKEGFRFEVLFYFVWRRLCRLLKITIAYCQLCYGSYLCQTLIKHLYETILLAIYFFYPV